MENYFILIIFQSFSLFSFNALCFNLDEGQNAQIIFLLVIIEYSQVVGYDHCNVIK